MNIQFEDFFKFFVYSLAIFGFFVIVALASSSTNVKLTIESENQTENKKLTSTSDITANERSDMYNFWLTSQP